ncbi:hypothetical protein F8388_016265 [Cannabis sativa]|uniref:Uncharacterized protein n=1 Tax=Cannabis sativa TaxID=3483 RepID=A0A7J6HU82_CANSA|nr:hypothetical protein F8388_016265 [Cannabis sativa]KAF4398258.1 hypothetical protein G4B88_007537 [Cannabis sativa]
MAIVLGVPVVDYPEKYLGLPCYTRQQAVAQRWTKPTPRIFELICDAANYNVSKFSGAGVIIRDTNGAVHALSTWSWSSLFEPNIVEAFKSIPAWYSVLAVFESYCVNVI